jgi:hypothetical protein
VYPGQAHQSSVGGTPLRRSMSKNVQRLTGGKNTRPRGRHWIDMVSGAVCVELVPFGKPHWDRVRGRPRDVNHQRFWDGRGRWGIETGVWRCRRAGRERSTCSYRAGPCPVR